MISHDFPAGTQRPEFPAGTQRPLTGRRHLLTGLRHPLWGYGTTNADARVGIGMLKGGFKHLIKKAIN